MVTRQGLTPLERKGAFAQAAIVAETTMSAAAREFGVSWTHLRACFEGERTPSDELRERVATFCGVPADRFWGRRGAARSPRRRAAAAEARAELANAAT